MKITYPHMGEAYIAVKGLFDDIGVESVIPPFTTERTVKHGSKLSPESVCLPFKIMLGNYMNSLDMGADTILITGSCGPCRYGYYGPIQKEILNDAGYKDFDMIVLDPPKENPRLFMESVRKISSNGKTNPLSALLRAYKVCCEVEKLNALLYYVRPRAYDKNQVKAIMHGFKSQVVNVKGTRDIIGFVHETMDKLSKVEIDKDYTPLKIGIIGEIYTIIEPFTNLNVEERLGNLGIEVHRSMTVKDWAQNTIILPLTGRKSYKNEKRLSKPYLPTLIGGHAQQCIGHAIQYAQKNYDGLVQIYPMTCMPEIVSRSILPQIEKDYGIPILYLIVDEQTGEAGYQTRLEAFADYVANISKRKQPIATSFAH